MASRLEKSLKAHSRSGRHHSEGSRVTAVTRRQQLRQKIVCRRVRLVSFNPYCYVLLPGRLGSSLAFGSRASGPGSNMEKMSTRANILVHRPFDQLRYNCGNVPNCRFMG